MTERFYADGFQTAAPQSKFPASLAMILAANLLPLLGVIFAGWSVFIILALYWLENVAVGVVTVLKMLNCRGSSVGEGKVGLAGFFAMHYGIFTFVHGVFVVALGGFAGKEYYGPAGVNYNPWLLGLTAATIFGTHLFSYAVDFFRRGEGREKSAGDLMWRPYPRMIVLHLTILGGAFAAMALGAAWPVIAILVVLKTALDAAMHLFWRV